MGNARATEATRKLTRPGGLLDYGPDLSRLLIRVMRELGRGRPVPRERVNRIIDDLGMARDDAYARCFLASSFPGGGQDSAESPI